MVPRTYPESFSFQGDCSKTAGGDRLKIARAIQLPLTSNISG